MSAAVNKGKTNVNKQSKTVMRDRTSQGLRDVLFDEIDALRSGDADPRRALAVANLARQIVGTVKAELEFARQAEDIKGNGAAALGTLSLGSNLPHVSIAADHATARSSGIRQRGSAK